jgi:PAS domain S-box-containing protein
VSSQQQSEALLAAARDAVIVVDDARTFVDVNPAASRLFGVSAPSCSAAASMTSSTPA